MIESKTDFKGKAAVTGMAAMKPYSILVLLEVQLEDGMAPRGVLVHGSGGDGAHPVAVP